MAKRVTLRDVGVRLNLWKAETFDRNVAGIRKGFGSLAKGVANLAVQMAIFEAAARTMRARLGDRMLAANARRLASALGVVGTAVDLANASYDRFRAGLGIINEQTVEHARYLVRQADALGVTTDEMQQLTFAFGQFGLTESDVVTTLERFARSAEDALHKVHGPTSQAREQFEKLGVAVERLKGEGSLRILEEVAHAYQNAEDAQKAKSAIYRLLGEDVSAIFGEQLARRLIPALEGGAEGITGLRRTARDTGLVVDDELLENGKQLALQFGILTKQIEVFWMEVGLRLAPAVEILVELWQDLIIANRDWLELRLDQAAEVITWAVERMDYAFRSVDWQWVTAVFLGSLAFLQLGAGLISATASAVVFFGTIYAVNAMLGWVGFSLWGVIAGLAGMIVEMVAAAVAAIGLSGALALLGTATGILLVIGVPLLFMLGGLMSWLVLIVLAVDDLLAFMAGGDSIIGRFFAQIESGEGVVGALWQVLVQLGRIMFDTFMLGVEVVLAFGQVLAEVLGGDAPDDPIVLFIGALKGLLGFVRDALYVVAYLFAFLATRLELARDSVRELGESFRDLMDAYGAWQNVRLTDPTTWGQFVGDLQGIYWRDDSAGSVTDNRQLYIEQHITSGDPQEVQDATRRGARELMEGSQQ